METKIDITIKQFIEQYLIPQNKWGNYGDVNYIDYGGVQLRFNQDYIDILELITPDAHGEDFYILMEGTLDLSDFILDYSEDMVFSSIKINREYLKGVVSFIGFNNLINEFESSYDPLILKEIIIGVSCSAIGYGLTGDIDRRWDFSDYVSNKQDEDISDEDYMNNLIEKELIEMGLDI